MNILWIMADQLRWDYLSCYGAKHIETPNLDWLASKRPNGRRYWLPRVCVIDGVAQIFNRLGESQAVAYRT